MRSVSHLYLLDEKKSGRLAYRALISHMEPRGTEMAQAHLENGFLLFLCFWLLVLLLGRQQGETHSHGSQEAWRRCTAGLSARVTNQKPPKCPSASDRTG